MTGVPGFRVDCPHYRNTLARLPNWQAFRGLQLFLAAGRSTQNPTNIPKVPFSYAEKRISVEYEISIQSGTGFASYNIIANVNRRILFERIYYGKETFSSSRAMDKTGNEKPSTSCGPEHTDKGNRY